jgi:putative transposase
MVLYRRNFIPGGTFFFTVTLADRRSSVLVDHIDALRKAFRMTRHERPFTIDAIVILPDHLHAIFTLPLQDADFSGRWRRIKGYFSSHAIKSGIAVERFANGDYALWQRRFWEHTIRDENDFFPSRRLYSFQSDQTRPRFSRSRLAALVLPSLRASRIIARRLGGRCK